MPGLDFFTNNNDVTALPEVATEIPVKTVDNMTDNVYYNPRLDPKNYLEGPLSHNAATRLRQMLARPGIVVSYSRLDDISYVSNRLNRLHPAFVMALVPDVLLKQVSTVYTRVELQQLLLASANLTLLLPP